MPKFFEHISRQKGYYDPEHKAYVDHDTTMDYLQRIVRRFKTKNKLEEPTSQLIDLFDMSKYDERRVNHKQVSHIMKWVKWYQTQLGILYNDHGDEECDDEYVGGDGNSLTKYEKQQLLYERLAYEINKNKIGYSTMLFIIKEMERPDFRKYKNVLLPLLFTLCNESFINAVKESKNSIQYLIESEKTDIKLFDFSLIFVKKITIF